ncbi:SDR family oxidoreductase [Amycolatopsis sp. SID8362]|uniref:SDR family oxidoreductase n=1 Tax=Amycolatopsis sp. SID8362 TaxID=2690346 RepID=UPI0013706B19|nr:SDR family oxidoreductase [Amycolatopsis sp. SID8362]NBH06530.1 NAD-dependent epimerase/dehydratase family protein [Amycolatopsis sp. SID8362]NED43227.1 SDR family oxidoreductase [Amycolatopsis sp. SID8362]
MRIFVTGASGWVGSAVVPELIGAGHQVVGLARSDSSAAKIAATGAEVVRGSLDDLDVLRAGAAGSDGVVHLAFMHDFTQFDASIATDARVIETLGAALESTGKPLVVTAGTPAIPGQVATERDRPPAGSAAAGRTANAELALGLARRGVRSSVVGLPRSVHGEGDHGFIGRLVDIAREKGVSGYVGDGSNRWPAVHVKDAARVYRLAVERAPAGSMLHAVGDEGVPTRDIATAIGRHLNLPAASAPAEDFGFLGGLLSVDQPASAALTRELLGWQPTEPGLIEDIDKGHYFD